MESLWGSEISRDKYDQNPNRSVNERGLFTEGLGARRGLAQ